MNGDLNRAGNGHTDPPGPRVSNRLFTIPNLLCMIRLAGAFVLVAIAWLELPQVFLWSFLFLAMTDWLDGKLAILLDQRSVFGARLDSWADAALFVALLAGLVLFFGETLIREAAWVMPALVTYLVSITAGFWKYGRWPSYHTRSAKTAWFFTVVGVLGLFYGWSAWWLRIALASTTLANLEAIAITAVSPAWRVDVTSIYHAWRDTRQSKGASGSGSD